MVQPEHSAKGNPGTGGVEMGQSELEHHRAHCSAELAIYSECKGPDCCKPQVNSQSCGKADFDHRLPVFFLHFCKREFRKFL